MDSGYDYMWQDYGRANRQYPYEGVAEYGPADTTYDMAYGGGYDDGYAPMAQRPRMMGPLGGRGMSSRGPGMGQRGSGMGSRGVGMRPLAGSRPRGAGMGPQSLMGGSFTQGAPMGGRGRARGSQRGTSMGRGRGSRGSKAMQANGMPVPKSFAQKATKRPVELNEHGEPRISLPGLGNFSSYKNTIQEYCTRKHLSRPEYKVKRTCIATGETDEYEHRAQKVDWNKLFMEGAKEIPIEDIEAAKAEKEKSAEIDGESSVEVANEEVEPMDVPVEAIEKTEDEAIEKTEDEAKDVATDKTASEATAGKSKEVQKNALAKKGDGKVDRRRIEYKGELLTKKEFIQKKKGEEADYTYLATLTVGKHSFTTDVATDSERGACMRAGFGLLKLLKYIPSAAVFETHQESMAKTVGQKRPLSAVGKSGPKKTSKP